MKIFGIYFALILVSGADPLEEEVAKLNAQFSKLEGYQVTYEAVTQEGKKGIFEVGVDFE